MCFKQWLLISLLICCCVASSVRIYFIACDKNGFQCVTQNGKIIVSYTCPKTTPDATFYVWDFRAPVTAIKIKIESCPTLRLSFQCSNVGRMITDLTVSNVTNLLIIKSVLTHNPVNVHFENISYLNYIPENTFSQIKSKTYRPGCSLPATDLQNLYFTRINIGTVATKAFNELKDFYNFSWNEVKVERMEHSAVQLEFNQAGNFSIRKSNLEVCEHLAFRIVGRHAEFFENKFVELFPGAINGTIEHFTFNINSVNNLQSYGISILSETVQISDNRFEYLRAGAFEKISPGLLHSSHRSFGMLKFVYEFSHNYVNFMDAASLNPDVASYDNVATNMKFVKNALYCSCENVGWIFFGVGLGYQSASLVDFYETVVDEGFQNVCSFTTCNLPVKKAQKMTENGKCLENVNVESLCGQVEEGQRNISVATAKVKPFGNAAKISAGPSLNPLLSPKYLLLISVTTFFVGTLL